MKFTIPANLELERILLAQETITVNRRVNTGLTKTYKVAPIKSKNLVKHLPYCYWLIDTIIQKRERSDTGSPWIHLNTEILDRFIPEPTRVLVLSILESLNVVEINRYYTRPEYLCGQYIKGTSRQYKIHGNYLETGLKIIDLSDQKFDIRYQKLVRGKTNDLLNSSHYPEYSFQRDCLINIHFDTASALAYTNTLKDKIDKDKYDYMMNKIDSISTGNHQINLNNKVNRFFSTVTNMNSILRSYITDTNNNPLISIDFKSSHTYHLLHILDTHSKKGRYIIEPIISNDISTTIDIDIYKINEGGKGMYPYVPTFFDEVAKIREILLKTGIYEYVQEQYRLSYGLDITRENAKEIFIQRFQNGKYPNQKMTKWVKGLFPAITAYIEKKGHTEMVNEIMLQESKLLNNHIIRRIARQVPTATVYNIFDAVLVDAESFDMVYNIVLEESKSFFGFDVPVKIERLRKPLIACESIDTVDECHAPSVEDHPIHELPIWMQVRRPVAKWLT